MLLEILFAKKRKHRRKITSWKLQVGIAKRSSFLIFNSEATHNINPFFNLIINLNLTS